MKRKRTLILFILLGSLSFIVNCKNSKANEEDIKLLEEIRNNYGDDYKVKFSPFIELNVILKQGTTIKHDEINQIFSVFFLNGKNKRVTKFVYLNLFDSKKKFLFQYYYDDDQIKYSKKRVYYY